MADIVDKATRSRMMAGIRGGNTKPERELRSALHVRGLRYRLHVNGIVGRPDLVFPRFHALVFVHGCFWHRHEGCRYATTPATRPEFWQQKFAANIVRDKRVQDQLVEAGWRIATVWECALRKQGQIVVAAELIDAWLRSKEPSLEIDEQGFAAIHQAN